MAQEVVREADRVVTQKVAQGAALEAVLVLAREAAQVVAR